MCKFAWYLNYIHKLPFKDSFATMQGKMLHKICEDYASSEIRIRELREAIGDANKKDKEMMMREIQELQRYFDYTSRVYYYYRNEFEPWKYVDGYKETAKLCNSCEFYNEDTKSCNVIDEKVDEFAGCPRKEARESFRLINQVFGVDGDQNPLNRKILAIEKEFHIELDNGIPIYGFIDIVSELDEDTVEIIDWKFGKWQLPQDEAIYDIQLRMYAVAASILYPQYKNIICTLEYPRYYGSRSKPSSVTVTFNQADLEETKNVIAEAWEYVNTQNLLVRSPSYTCKYMCIGYEECNKLWTEITGLEDRIG